MANKNIITPENFNADNFEFTKPKKNKDGRWQALILYKVNGQSMSCYFETPFSRTPFGVSRAAENYEYTCLISAKTNNPENQELVKHWFDEWKRFDFKMMDFILQHSELITGEVIEMDYDMLKKLKMYRPIIKETKDKEGNPYPFNIQLKFNKIINQEDGTDKPDILVFKGGSEPLEIEGWSDLVENVPSGTFMRSIIQPRFYFINDKFGITTRINQLEIPNVVKYGKPTSFAFSKAPEGASGGGAAAAEEEEEVENGPAAEEEEEVEDSEEEEVEEVEEEEEEDA